MTTSGFLAALYEQFEGDGYIIYGGKDGNFQSCHVEDITTWLWPTGEDVYFRMCPVMRPPKYGRGKAMDSCALLFVWLDLDVGEKDNGKSYFKSKEEALRWVKEHIPYSFVVDSGRGLHVYCILEDPIYVIDQDSFEFAHGLSQRFQQWARERCPYEIDSTHDLARVLRLPGSVHSETRSLVTVASQSSNRVTQEMLKTLPISKKLSGPLTSANSESGEIVLDPNCVVDQEQLMAVATINANFLATWLGQREPSGDTSPSGLRFGMISFLMAMQLPKQDVVNITIRYLIDRKNLRPDQIKLDRPNVWLTEMAKCAVEQFTSDDIDVVVEEQPEDEQLRAVAALMEFPDASVLTGVSRFLIMADDDEAVDSVFQLHIRNHEGDIIKVSLSNPLSRVDCRRVIFERTGIALPHYTTKQATQANRKWEHAIQLAYRIAEVITPVESATAEMLLAAIKASVNAGDLALSLEDAKDTGNPYKDGDVYVIPTLQLNARATTQYPALRSNREMHRAVRELRNVGVEKKAQMHKGVRMACLLVPSALVEEAS